MASLLDLVLGDKDVVIGSLCTGYGGLDLGLLAVLGRGRIAWAADCDPHVGTILATRMRGVPNLGDVRQIDWSLVEPVDAVTAGFPCQDISAAGRRAGIEKGERSGIWADIVAGVRVLRPALLVVENVAALRWRDGGLHRVLGDLAEAGYDAFWRSVRASDVGCAHHRERVFLLAWSRAHAAKDAADSASTRWRSPRRGRPNTPSSVGPSSQLARRGELCFEAVADTDRGGLAVCSHPDCAQLQPPHPQRLRDTHGFRAAAADSDRDQPERRRGDQQLAGASRAAAPAEDQREWDGYAVVDRGEVVAGTDGIGHEGCHPPQRSGRQRPTVVPDLPESQTAAPQGPHEAVNWGQYTAAVRRWERLLGRAAPHPTQPGRHGRPVLAPAFVEHLMGLPQGWISDLPLPRTAQLRALGNGVVPAQAAYAVALLLADLAALLIDRRFEDGSETKAA